MAQTEIHIHSIFELQEKVIPQVVLCLKNIFNTNINTNKPTNTTITADKEACVIIRLSGELGAGKTTFTQTLARTLGVVEDLQSPTFVIMKIYDALFLNEPKNFLHVDAYRLKNSDELKKINFIEYATKPSTITCIEWPEIVADIFDELKKVSIEKNQETFFIDIDIKHVEQDKNNPDAVNYRKVYIKTNA